MTNMEIKVLVADDELPARGELKYQLASMPHVNVIGECANGKEVISFLETHPQVDLLFLDIEMPIMNGLEAAQKIIGMNHSVKLSSLPVTANLRCRLSSWKLSTIF